MTPLQEYLVYPNGRIDNDSMPSLVCRLLVEDEWSKTARERACLSIEVLCGLCVAIGLWH
jgi:hypothetical protein